MTDHRSGNDAGTHRPRPLAPRTLLGLQIAAVVILGGWALHATASVSALIAAAILLAVLVAPLDRRVAARTGRLWIGHLAAFGAIVLALVTFAGGLLFVAQRVAAEFPPLGQMSGALTGSQTTAASGSGDAASGGPTGEGGTLGELFGGASDAVDQIVSRLAELASGVALAALQYVTVALGGLVLVVFLALLLLGDASRWQARMSHVFGEGRAREMRDATAVVSRQLMRFLLVRAGLGLVTAVLYMLWLWSFGVGLILVWGVLTFLLTFIPNLGSIVSGILPTIYAFLTKDFGTALAVAAGLTAIEQVIGNYIDPRVQGRQVSISPTVILGALLLFGWIWGVLGALLSTPVLIAVVIGFARINRLRPVALLLSHARSYEELHQAVHR